MEAWLEEQLGEDLAGALSRAATSEVESADALARLRALRPNDASGLGGAAGFQPANYWFKEAGYRWRVQSFVNSKTLDGDARAAMLLAHSNGLGRRVVGYRVPWSMAIAVARALIARDPRFTHLAAMSDDGAFGFVLASHGGYVIHQFHDDETVFTVSRWHPLHGKP